MAQPCLFYRFSCNPLIFLLDYSYENINIQQGILAHSDGDVVLHALCDALLGALALGDIGQHFSDTDDANKNQNSAVFLDHIYSMITDKGYTLGNMDCTIHCERPKLRNHIDAMRENIAKLLNVDIDQISIKATRGEKMGYVGREEGVAASVVVLLQKIK